jgi:hypothetical protein
MAWWKGHSDRATGIWPVSMDNHKPMKQSNMVQASNTEYYPIFRSLVRVNSQIHMVHAIKAGKFTTRPGLSVDGVDNHLIMMEATVLRCNDQQLRNTYSTQPQEVAIPPTKWKATHTMCMPPSWRSDLYTQISQADSLNNQE